MPRLLLAALIASAVALGLAPKAHGFVYWANFASTTVGRANSDGSDADQSFVTGASSPCGVAVDGAHVYWANQGTDSIGRANLNGTGANPTFITGATNPCGVAVDASHIYWANGNIANTIGRADLDGAAASVSQTLVTGLDNPCGVAVNGAFVYWADNGVGPGTMLGRAGLDGGSPAGNFITGASSPCGVAVDATNVYWANSGGSSIGRANVSGDPASVNQSFITTTGGGPCGAPVDGGHIYWAGLGSADRVGRADLDGNAASIDEGFVTGAHGPCGVAVNGLVRPTCQDTSGSTGYAQAVAVSLPCTSGSGLTGFSVASPPAHGQISGLNASTGNLTYTPELGFNGSDSFTFIAADIGSNSKPATATITVGKAPNDLRIAQVKRNRHGGTARVILNLPDPGEINVDAHARVKVAFQWDHGAILEVKPDRTLKRRLNQTGKARVPIDITFTPTGGDPAAQSLALALRKD